MTNERTETLKSRERAGITHAPAKLPKGKVRPAAHHILNRPDFLGVVATKIAAGETFGEIDDHELLVGLREQVERVKAGDLAPIEAMLLSQAKALEVLFTRLLCRGMGTDHVAAFQANVSLALKAQAQSRATLQTLVEAKQPRAVAFVRQANIAQQQQVNNGMAAVHAHAGKDAVSRNELLEGATHEQQQWMVPGAQAAPARCNQAMEAVGGIDGAEDQRRQGTSGGQ